MESMTLNIYRVLDEYLEVDINDKIENKLNDGKIKYTKNEIKNYKIGIDDYNFYFYFGFRENPNSRIAWYEKLKELFPLEDKEKTVTAAYGVLLIEGNINKISEKDGKIIKDKKIKYVITFGYGNNTVSKFIDFNYGLEMASRMAKADSINTQSSKFFSLNKNKSLVIYNSANFNTQVGEAVDYLTAEIEEYQNRSSVNQLLELINKEAVFSTYIRVALNKEFSFENIVKILKNLDNIYNTYKERIAIPKLSYLTSKDRLIIEKLDKKMSEEALNDEENTKISIGTYTKINGDIKIINDIDSFTLSVGRRKQTYNELNVNNIKDFMKNNNIQNIKDVKVTTEHLQKEELYKYLDYTTQLEDNNEYFCLSNGRWTKFNKEYIEKVEEEIKRRICPITEYLDEYNLEDLQKLREKYSEKIINKKYVNTDENNKKLYEERVYNFYIADKMHGEVFDRKTVNTIEVSDIYTKDTHELIHAKIGEPGKFIECINQSIYGARHFVHNKKEVIEKLENKIENVKTITMLFVITNKDVWKNKEINRFKSLRFKLNLLEWANDVEELNFNKRIIIAKK